MKEKNTNNTKSLNSAELKKMEHFKNETESGVHVMKTSGEYITPHWHNHYEIDYCYDGVGCTVLNGTQYPCRRGTFSFITLSDVHEHRGSMSPDNNNREKLKFINLNFNFNAVSYSVTTELLHNFSGFVFQCNDAEALKFESTLNLIKTEEESNAPLKERYIKNLLDNLLIDVYRKKKENDKCPQTLYNADLGQNTDDTDISSGISLPRSIQKVVYFVNANFKEQITLKDVSDYAEIDYTSIGKYIKKYLKMSFKEYLTDIRLTYAKNLLCNTDVTITELAFYCGYQTVPYFISEFKKKYGCSPREYRQSTEI